MKLRGKQMLSWLMAVTMLLSMLPMQVFATDYQEGGLSGYLKPLPTDVSELKEGDTYTGTTLPSVVPAGMEWVVTATVPNCGLEVHPSHTRECYGTLLKCDHKDGHLASCYGENATLIWKICEGNDHLASVSGVDAAQRSDDANSLWKSIYDSAYNKAYNAYLDEHGEGFLGANKILAAAAGTDAGLEAANAKTYCYTVADGAEASCGHNHALTYTECYYKICNKEIHEEHTVACGIRYTWTLQYTQHTVTWLNGDGSVAKNETEVDYSTPPSYPNGSPAITKAPTVDTVYTHTGWTYEPALENGGIVGDTTCTPTFSSSARAYTITWVIDEDTTKTTSVPYGETPSYDASKEYHDFVEWTPAVAAVTGEAQYTAVWKPSLDENKNGIADQEETYTVVYVDGLGGTQTYENLKWGDATPAYQGTLEQEGFNFGGWGNVPATVTAPATGNTITYTAQWNELTVFTVTLVDRGNQSTENMYSGDTMAEPEDPTWDADHDFLGWFAEGVDEKFDFNTEITGSLTLTAKWQEDYNRDDVNDAEQPKYTVTYVDGKGTTLYTETVLVGMPTPTIDDPSMAKYIFVDWDSEVAATVTGHVTYTAVWYDDSNENGVNDEDEKICVTVPANGTVTVNGTSVNGEYVYDSKTVTELSVVVTPDAANGYYVDTVEIDGSVVNAAQETMTFSTTVAAKDGLTIEAAFAERTMAIIGDASDASDRADIPFAGSETALENASELQAAMLTAILGEDYATKYPGTQLYIYNSKTGYELWSGYNILATGSFGTQLKEENVTRETETLKVVLPADGKYPEISVEGIKLNVVESRPTVSIDISKVVAIAAFDAVSEIETALEKAVTASYTDASGKAVFVAVDVTITSTVDITAAKDGTAQIVTYTAKVSSTDDYVGAEKTGLTVQATGIVHNSVVTENDDKLTIDGIADFSDVAPGSYTITVTPDTANGQYVTAIKVNNEEIPVTYKDCVATATLTTVNGDSASNTYTVTAEYAVRDLVVKTETVSVPYNPARDTEAAVLERVFGYTVTNTGLAYADCTVKPVDGIGLGEKQFTIAWNGDDQIPSVTETVSVNLSEDRKAATIEWTETLSIEVDKDITGVAQALKESGFVKVLPEGAAAIVEYALAENQTAPVSGETKTVNVVVFVEEGETWLKNSVTVPVTVTGKAYAATVNVTETTDNGDYTITDDGVDGYMNEILTIEITPASDYYVQSVTIDGQEMGGTYSATKYTGKFNVGYDTTYDVVIGYAPAEFALDADGQLTFYHGVELPTDQKVYEAVITDPAYTSGTVSVKYLAREATSVSVTIPAIGELYQGGTYDLPLAEKWMPIGNEVEEVDVNRVVDKAVDEVKAALETGDYGTAWNLAKNLTATIATALADYGCHEFGAAGNGSSEKLAVTYTSDMKVITDNTLVVNLVDDRAETSMSAKNATVVYKDYTNEDLMTAFAPVVTNKSGAVFGDVVFMDMEAVDAGTYTVTLKYVGDQENKPCTTDVTLVVDKAPSAIDFDSQVVTYGDEYTFELVKNPADLDTINFMIGIDLHDIDGNGIAPYIQLVLPSWLNTLLETVVGQDGGDMTLNELKDALGGLENLGAANDTIAALSKIITEVQEGLDVADMTIKVGGEMHPENIGLYLAGAVSVDSNYETSYTADYLLVVPKATEAQLAWNYDDKNGIISQMALETSGYLGAHSTVDAIYNENITSGIKYVLMLATVDANGEMVFDFLRLTSEELVAVKANGAYVQMAYYLDIDNEMYYAAPIVRPFIIVPNTVEVAFVGDDLEENYDCVFTFNNKSHAMAVTVDGVVMEPTTADANPSLTVTYTGIQTNTEAYNSTIPPTHAGVYAVTASYTECDDEGNLKAVGAAVGMMLIKPAEASVIVEDAIIEYKDVNRVFSDYITVETDSGVVSPDVTVITAGIASNGDFSKDGWAVVGGNVNVDFPDWVDTILREYAPSIYQEGGMTPAEFIEKTINKVPDLEEYVKSLGVEVDLTGLTDALTKVLTEVSEIAAELPENVTLTFVEDATFKSVGAYVVLGVVTDSDHMPAADAGIIAVVPSVEKDYLKFNYEDENNVFSEALLKQVDLNASAYTDATYTVLDEEATAKVVNLFLSIDSEGNLVTETDWAKLAKGAYIQVSYIPLEVAGEMTVSDLIARPVVLVPDALKVTFKDANGADNYLREFTYGDENIGMGEIVVTELDGVTAVDTSKGELTIRYIGVEDDAEGYDSAEVPTDAGLYTVVVTYIEHDENGDVDRMGGIVGGLRINKSELVFDLLDTEVTYNGEEQFVEINNPENADFVYATIDRTNNVATLVLEEDAQALYDELKNAMVENGIMADDDVYDVANVLGAIGSVLNKIDALDLPETIDPYASKILNKLHEVLDTLPQNGTVYVNGEDPINVGEYEFYAISVAANYAPEVSEGKLIIKPVELEVIVSDAEKTCEQDDPAFGYEITKGELMDGDELVVDYSRDEGEAVGEYAVTAEVEENPNYVVTVVPGKLTISHDYEAVVTEPTCTEDGYTTYTCACGDSYVDDEVATTSHSWGEWTETKAPTADEAGEKSRKCGTCGEVETEELPKLNTVASPEFSAEGGVYETAQTVTASCGTEGAKIYYTTDGMDPVVENGVVKNGKEYTSPITVDQTMTIKAIAVMDGMANSEVITVEYTIKYRLSFADSDTVVLPKTGKALFLIAAAYDENDCQQDCVMVAVDADDTAEDVDLTWNKTLQDGWKLRAYALSQADYTPVYLPAILTAK